jgi:hypothetical protein
MVWRLSIFKTESINVGVIDTDENGNNNDNENENENNNDNENENDRIRNRVNSDLYKDMVDIMEPEYNLCRGSPRGEVADCLTSYFVYI